MNANEITTLRKEQCLASTLARLYTSKETSVRNAYGRPSTRKIAIEEYILHEMDKLGGYNYRILSHNGFVFSCGYLYENLNFEKGEKEVIMVIHTKTTRNEYNVTRFLCDNGTSWVTNDYFKSVYGLDLSKLYSER